MNEFTLINTFKKFQNPGSGVIKGIGDDAAVLALDGKRYQLFTTDMCVEGVHFLRRTQATKAGWKVMAVNVSDIAAMGGVPTFAVVSLAVPKDMSEKYLRGIYEGMYACLRKFGVSLVGGDTTRSTKFTINVAMLGEVEKKKLVTRAGAKPGDHLFVTGPLGGSLKSGRHLTFIPRVKEARWLVDHLGPTAMMDISDGLAGDLRHILKASGVGAVLEEAKIPCHQGVTVRQALTDGEDFELLFAVPATRAGKCPFPLIGFITGDANKLMIQAKDGAVSLLNMKGFEHF